METMLPQMSPNRRLQRRFVSPSLSTGGFACTTGSIVLISRHGASMHAWLVVKVGTKSDCNYKVSMNKQKVVSVAALLAQW